MARIPPAVAAVRTAVRRCLRDLPPASPVLVACSGGADSLALAAATAFVAPRLGLRAGLITVDHGLQDGSAVRAAGVASWAAGLGFAPAEVATVDVAGLPGGPEAAARTARYAALTAAARRHATAGLPDVPVLLGHTRDDQAETVLLALARGAGPRGLAGMPYRRGVLVRPLLGVSRADTRAACAALGQVPWVDPHNSDPAYARSRVRGDALPALVAALGPAVVDNLARTAAQVAADNTALDALAAEALAAAAGHTGLPVVAAGSVGHACLPVTVGPASDGADVVRTGDVLSVVFLRGLAPAVRTRVLHAWARRLGVPGGSLSHRHVEALDALVTDWHGQGPTALPGAILVTRRDGGLWRTGPDG